MFPYTNEGIDVANFWIPFQKDTGWYVLDLHFLDFDQTLIIFCIFLNTMPK